MSFKVAAISVEQKKSDYTLTRSLLHKTFTREKKSGYFSKFLFSYGIG